jgi:glutamate racemase
MPNNDHPIGVFDSGYGGLTVLREIVKKLPQYDYLYLGDNARAPYGTRSYDTIYQYTLECIQQLFDRGCHLVIVACNTSSAKALRTIQQNDLPRIAPHKRVLGVIRPTSEIVGKYSKTGHIGVLGTNGTVSSYSYPLEIGKFFPEMKVFQEACPMWVPLVENHEFESEGADFFIKKNIDHLFSKSDRIDTIILGCTHYPLLINKIKKYLPDHVTLLSQGEIVSERLVDYLQRHPEIEQNCSKGGKLEFLTTDSPENFDGAAEFFFGKEVRAKNVSI